MQLRMITLTCVLAVFSPMVWGQTAAPTTLPATLPSAGEAAVVAPPGSWVGLLNGNNVYVRSGPGEQAYVCNRISVPDKVTVVGKTGDWLKILPPTGCFSVVSKAFVQLDPTGKVGTMTGDNVFCRAAGDLRSSQFFAVQRRLRKGEQVQILGEIAEYYKIAPPSDVYFFISSHYIHPESGSIPPEFASAEAAPEMAASQPSLAVVPEMPTASPTNKVVSLPGGVSQDSFAEVEKAFKAEFAKPLEQRDLKGLLVRYRMLNVAPSLKPYVDARVNFIQGQIAEMGDLGRTQELAKSQAAKQKEYEARRVELQKTIPATEPARTFAAKGVLVKSDVFAGSAASISKRYMIIDPQTNMVNAYIQGGNGVDLDGSVGMNVGVFGQRHFDRNLLRYVVDPEELVILGVGEGLKSPPKPTVKIPKPVLPPKTAIPPSPTEGKPVSPLEAAAQAESAAETSATPASAPATMPADGLPVAGEQAAPADQVDEKEYK